MIHQQLCSQSHVDPFRHRGLLSWAVLLHVHSREQAYIMSIVHKQHADVLHHTLRVSPLLERCTFFVFDSARASFCLATTAVAVKFPFR